MKAEIVVDSQGVEEITKTQNKAIRFIKEKLMELIYCISTVSLNQEDEKEEEKIDPSDSNDNPTSNIVDHIDINYPAQDNTQDTMNTAQMNNQISVDSIRHKLGTKGRLDTVPEICSGVTENVDQGSGNIINELIKQKEREKLEKQKFKQQLFEKLEKQYSDKIHQRVHWSSAEAPLKFKGVTNTKLYSQLSQK